MGKKLLVVCVCLFNLFIAGLYLSPLKDIRPPDLMHFYFAGKLVAQGRISELYHRPSYEPMLAELRGTERLVSVYFNRPAFEAPLFVPLSWFSYRAAARLMLACNLVLLGLLVWKLPVWYHAPPFVRIWLFIFIPFIFSLGLAQDTLLLTLLAALSLRLAWDGRDIPAGILLAACCFKPHVIFLVPLAFIADRRWKMLSSFLATGALLAGLTFAAVGFNGILEWIDLLQAPSTDSVTELMVNSRVLGIYFGFPAMLAAGVFTVVSFAIVLRRGSFTEKFLAAIFASLLLSPHTYLQDYSLLAIAAMVPVYPVLQYVLLLPWHYFYPRTDHLPMVFVALGYLGVMAVKLLVSRIRKTRTGAVPARPASADIGASVLQSTAITGGLE